MAKEREAAAVPSDHTLLERYRRGSDDAATQLYLRYARRLYGLAQAQLGPGLRHCVDVDELVQSVFGSFFRRAARGYYDVPAGEELWRLFLVLALHKIRNQAAYHHAAKRDVRRTEPALVERGDDGDDAAYVFLQLAVAEALERLPALQRQLVEMRIEGCEVTDMAQKTGRSRRTVERLLQEARQRLSELLGERT